MRDSDRESCDPVATHSLAGESGESLYLCIARDATARMEWESVGRMFLHFPLW